MIENAMDGLRLMRPMFIAIIAVLVAYYSHDRIKNLVGKFMAAVR